MQYCRTAPGHRTRRKYIKGLNKDGKLKQYSIVHFATHGILAEESEKYLNAGAEPGLLLTPPASGAPLEALELDDGILSASEIAKLDLNASWVVLSACNTAAPGGKISTEALSGLARAFFYAGARALLVSHWSVDSDAAVRLTTRTFLELRAENSIGRGEALRRSMLALMDDTSRPAWALPAVHPAVWAPFAVAGDSAR